MNWRNEMNKENCRESATNCQGTKESPSKTIQQWVKELKWTNKSRGRDPKGRALQIRTFLPVWDRQSSCFWKHFMRKVLFVLQRLG